MVDMVAQSTRAVTTAAFLHGCAEHAVTTAAFPYGCECMCRWQPSFNEAVAAYVCFDLKPNVALVRPSLLSTAQQSGIAKLIRIGAMANH